MKKYLLFSVVILVMMFGAMTVSAAVTGAIDSTNHFASLVRTPGASGSEVINFGKFTTQSAYNISITDDGLRGFAWGSEAGWIVMNCLDTTSGCTANNESFKVAVSSTGVLSGYAWGQKTGWINFGPFTNNNTSQVQIGRDGTFKGVNTEAGYAWSQRYGWIKFDCDDGACVATTFTPRAYRGSVGGSVGSSGQGSSGVGTPAEYSQCSDGIDNDADGFVDYGPDKGCYGMSDNTENTIVAPVTPVTPTVPGSADPVTPGDTTPSFPTEPSTTPSGTVFPGPQEQPSGTVVPTDTPITTQNEKMHNGLPVLKEEIGEFLKKWGAPLFLLIIVLIYLVRKFFIKNL